MIKIDGLQFKTKPWEHQLAALKWLMGRDCGGLYTDPGTGKSKVFIDLLVNRGFKRIIITGTKKPCETWVKQFTIHAEPGAFHVISLLGVPMQSKVEQVQNVTQGRNALGSDRPVVFIVNYDTIWAHPLSNLLIKFKPDCVIADESHRIKSPSGKWSNYLTRIGKCTPHRYILSGTMIAEDPLDAYGQFRFMDPNVFGTRVADFKARYHNYNPTMSARLGFPILDKNQPYKNMDEFYGKFWQHVFRIPSSVKLPKRTNIVVEFELNQKEAKAYDKIKKDGAIQCKQGTMLIENALTKVVRHQQAVCGFIQLEDEHGSKRLYTTGHTRTEAFMEIMEGFKPGEPVVVFCKFRKDIRNVLNVCTKMGITTSELSGREDTSDEWVAGKTQVIVVQYLSGSESIDLTRARYMIFYSLVHSYTQYFQAKKRTNRPGQDWPCRYYHLAATVDGKETVDHALIAALKRKQNLVKEVDAGRAEL